jgi:hypothetical protein
VPQLKLYTTHMFDTNVTRYATRARTHTHTELYSCKLLVLFKRKENHCDLGVWGGIRVLKFKFLYHATELHETWNDRHALRSLMQRDK